MILQPHHYEFAETLANLPFFFQEMASQTCEVMHILQKNPNQLPELVNNNDLQEYLLGGEVNEYIEFVDGYADVDVDELTEEESESNNLFSRWELSDEWLGSI